MAAARTTSAIRFLLNGETQSVSDVDPCQSVLALLRERLRRSGSKEGCAEGDCGACSVVLGELNDDQLELKTVNACIQFVPSLDGKALFTVEDLRQADGRLHPVQQAMVDCHGSQCGFCTPGFIMSLWSVYLQHENGGSRADETELRSALSGNLCRCTGYKPILKAGSKMFDYPRLHFDRDRVKQRLQALQREDALVYRYADKTFFAPRRLAELTHLRAEYPQATILAGCTDVGLWVNKQLRRLDTMIYIGQIDELKTIQQNENTLRIGAGATLSEAYRAISQYYPAMDEMWERFASRPIRNAGTLGGNIANGSPIGDSMPALIALDAQLILHSQRGCRALALEDFYLDYMKKDLHEDEIVSAITLPLPQSNKIFRCYKLAKRFDSDISAVFAAFALSRDANRVSAIKIAYGGMAATPKRASQTEAALHAQDWNETTVRDAMTALTQDFTPLSDMRASADYRLRAAQNLLYRFYLETRSDQALSNPQVNVFAA